MLGVPAFLKAYEKITQGCPALEQNFFMEGDISTLSKQRSAFDAALKAPSAPPKPAPPAPVREPPKPPQEPQPRAPAQTPGKPQGGGEKIAAERMRDDLVEKREIYLRSVFREDEDIFDVQARYVELEHQVKRTNANMEQLFSYLPPKGKEAEHETAIMGILNELEVWEQLQRYNQSQGLTDFANLEKADIAEIRRDVQEILRVKLPGEEQRFLDQARLRERGKSVLGEEHLPPSMLADQSFARKKEQIRSLRGKRAPAIAKPREEPEEVPQINVRPEPEYEEDLREEKEKEPSVKAIGGDEDLQVSKINVEEDSEIEYNLENIRGGLTRPARARDGVAGQDRAGVAAGARVRGEPFAAEAEQLGPRAGDRKPVYDGAVEELVPGQRAQEQPHSEEAAPAGRGRLAEGQAAAQARGKHKPLAAGRESAEREPGADERGQGVPEREEGAEQQNADRGNQAVG